MPGFGVVGNGPYIVVASEVVEVGVSVERGSDAVLGGEERGRADPPCGQAGEPRGIRSASL